MEHFKHIPKNTKFKNHACIHQVYIGVNNLLSEILQTKESNV